MLFIKLLQDPVQRSSEKQYFSIYMWLQMLFSLQKIQRQERSKQSELPKQEIPC